MIDPSQIGRSFGPNSYTVERAQISAFAAAIGETLAIYHDLAAARAAGLPDLPAPPTLATCYGLWANPALLAELDALGAPLPRLLHGAQEYRYYTPIYAGDVLTSAPRIVDISLKRGRSGPFTLLVLETLLHNQRGELAIEDTLTVVIRGDPDIPKELGTGGQEDTAGPAGQRGAETGAQRDQEANVRADPRVRPAPQLPTLALPALTLADLERYAAASGDHNPLHTDRAYARAAGLDDVIAHGMLIMGMLGQLVTRYVGPAGLRSFSARFGAITRLGEPLQAGGQIVDSPAAQPIEAELWVRDSAGHPRLDGRFTALPPNPSHTQTEIAP